MAFPDLELVPDTLKGPGFFLPYVAEATGIPDLGNNVIGLPFVDAGIPPEQIDPTRIKIYWDPDPNRPTGGSLNPGVTDVRFVSLAADKQSITLDFSQTASGDARLILEIDHTIQGVGATEPVIIYAGQPGQSAPPPPPTFSVTLNALFALTQEIGAQLVNPNFNVFYSPAGTETSSLLSNSVNAVVQDILGDPNPVVYGTTISVNPIGGTAVFTVNAVGANPDSDSVTATFRPRVYFGVNANPALATEADIEGLAGGPSGASPLRASRAGSFVFTALNQYVYYSFPSVYGPASPLDFMIGPFPGGMIFLGTVTITANTPGAPVNQYDIWRSTFTQDTTISGPQTLVISS